jgi:hypothetical protein
MTLESLALAVLLLSLPLGFAVEYFTLSRRLFGRSAGSDPSVFRLLWLCAASLLFFNAASWVYAVLVPRDPSLLVSRTIYFFIACMSIGFAFYAAREVGHFARDRLS